MFDGINKWLDGKKTVLAGIAGIFTTIGTAVATLQDGFQFADLNVIGGALVTTLAIFGLGGKAQKIIDALKAIDEKK